MVSRKAFSKLKRVLPLGAVTIFTIILLFRIIPIALFEPIRNADLEDLVFGYWLVFIGFVFITIGVLALPSTKNTQGKIVSYFFIAFGIVALVFSIVTGVQGFDTIQNDSNLRVMAMILFGTASVILLVDLVPRIFSKKGQGVIETVDNM